MNEREFPGLGEIAALLQPEPKEKQTTLNLANYVPSGHVRFGSQPLWAGPGRPPPAPGSAQASCTDSLWSPRPGLPKLDPWWGTELEVQHIASKPAVWGSQDATYIYAHFKRALSSRIFAFLTKWRGWVISTAHLQPGASLVEDLSQNKETAGDEIWSHKSPIRRLKITHRKTFYMN